MPRWSAKSLWEYEKSGDQYEREKQNIVYDPDSCVEPRYNWKTLEELRESVAIYVIYTHYCPVINETNTIG